MSISHNITSKLSAVVIALTAILATGCSKTDDILKTIPADATAVVHIDLKKVIDNAELRERGKSYALPKEFDDLSDNSLEEDLEMLYKMEKCVDLSNVFMVNIQPGLMDGSDEEKYGDFVTFPITDFDEFEKQIKGLDYSKESSEGGLDCYSMSKNEWSASYIFVNDSRSQGWSATAYGIWDADKQKTVVKTPKVVSEALKRADRNSIADCKGPAKVLNSDKVASVVMTDKVLKNKWITCSAELPGNGEVRFEANLMDEDGTLCAFDQYFSTVNTEILEYLPQDADLVAAMSCNVENLRKLIEELIGKFGSKSDVGVFKQYLKFVEPSGDIAFGANLSSFDKVLNSNFRHEELLLNGKWTAVATFKDPETTLEVLKSLAAYNIKSPMTPVADNKYEISIEKNLYHYDYTRDTDVFDEKLSATVYVGAIGKYLYISTVDVNKNTVSDQVKRVFDNASFGVYAHTPSKIKTYFDLPGEFTATARWKGSYTLMVDAKLENSTHGFIYDMINTSIKVEKQMKKNLKY